MWKDRGPGVKILWLWTIGTAAVLVTSVVRTRLRDMDQQFMNATQQPPNPEALADSEILIDDNPPAGKSMKGDQL
nr:basic leucine zipper/W2 domain protein [Ipomoea batatas]